MRRILLPRFVPPPNSDTRQALEKSPRPVKEPSATERTSSGKQAAQAVDVLETDEAVNRVEATGFDGTEALWEFKFGHRPVRTVVRDGEPWFVSADVCAVLGYVNARQAAGRLDEDEKGVCPIDTLGGRQQMVVINESGLHALIIGSEKPQAKAFRRWVTTDVLPAILRTGRYEASQPDGDGQASQQASVAPSLEFGRENLPIELADFLVLMGLPRLARAEAKAQELELVKSLIRQGLDQTSFMHPVSGRRVFTRPSLDAWWAVRKAKLAASTPSGP